VKIRIAVFIVIGATLTAAWMVFLMNPARQILQDANAQLSQQRAQLVEYQTTLDQLPTFLKTRDELTRQAQEINSKLFAKRDILRLFEHVTAIAQQNQVAVDELAPHVEELLTLNKAHSEPGKPQSLRIELHVSAGYLAFGKFLEALEQQAYFRSIERCQILTSPDDGGRLTCLVEFRALLGTSLGVS